MATKKVEQLDRVIIRFAGDSGDGMQLTGDRFTSETAVLGNDLATSRELRAPSPPVPSSSACAIPRLSPSQSLSSSSSGS